MMTRATGVEVAALMDKEMVAVADWGVAEESVT